MKIKIYKILGVALTVAMLVSLIVGFSVAPASAKTYDTNEWEKFETPKDGKTGDYVLYEDSDVDAIAITIDGTLYAGVDHDGDYEVFQSTDEGATWDMLDDYNGGQVIDIAVSPVDEEVVYFATEDAVYRTTDAGEKIKSMSTTGYTGDIVSVAVTYFNDAHIVVIATEDDVYVFDEGSTFGAWDPREVLTDPDNTGADYVLCAALSPFFEDDRQIVAVVVDADTSQTWVTTAIGGAGWADDVANTDHAGATPDIEAIADRARIAFPSDYDADPDSGDYVQFLSIAASGDADAGLYLIDGVETGGSNASVATPLDVDYDAWSLAVEGDASSAAILVGLEDNDSEEAFVRWSDDGGDSFESAQKEPSGEDYCQVLLDGDMAYAATSGDNSAFSVSTDGGDVWNQPSLIDTAFVGIVGWEHAGPNTYLFTSDAGFPGTAAGVNSVWATSNMGDSWERVISTDVTVVLSATKAKDFTTIHKSNYRDDFLWLEDGAAHSQAWKSDDGGQTWAWLKSTTPTQIGHWRVIDESEIIYFCNADGHMYRTRNGGTSWSDISDTGLGGGSFGGPQIDGATGMYMVWDGTGEIRISDDEGDSWEDANPDGNLPGANGAFDPGFGVPGDAGYNTIYAAASTGVYRYVIDESADWEEISAGFTADETDYGIAVMALPTIPPGSGAPDPDGTLYVYQSEAHSHPYPDTGHGIMRAVYPTDRDAGAPDYEVDWESIGTGGNAWMPGAPSISPAGITLFRADQDEAIVYLYTDTLNKPGKLAAPGDGTTSGREGSAMLTWEAMGDADSYEVQWAEDSEFEVDMNNQFTEVTSYRATGLMPGQSYYWRVRVEEGEPAWSPWSEVWSFTTALGAPQWNPFVGGIPESPANGATNVSLTPSFAWNPADWATGYEFILATDGNYSQAVVSKTGANALTNSVYLCEQTLDYETTYYWKVRAISKTSSSEWANAVFTTMAKAPAPPPAPTPTPTPEQPPLIDPVFLWVIIGIGALLVIALIILIVRTRRVA